MYACPLFSAVSLMDFNPNSAAFAPGTLALFQICYEKSSCSDIHKRAAACYR